MKGRGFDALGRSCAGGDRDVRRRFFEWESEREWVTWDHRFAVCLWIGLNRDAPVPRVIERVIMREHKTFGGDLRLSEVA